MVSEKPLITVKTISSKMVKQIAVVQYEGPDKPDSLHQQISMALADQKTEPFGWMPAKIVSENETGILTPRFWLVKFRGQFFWYRAPSGGALYNHFNPGLEQLFIG